ncbi:MAG: hypothetical protein AAGF12_22040 [Myxococcota bacterium]
MTSEAESRDSTPRGVLVPREHTEFYGVPYYDEELDVAQSTAHRLMVHETSVVLQALAAEAKVLVLSDEPIWYLHPETDEQRVYYGDVVLGTAEDSKRITADELALVMEVVTISDRRKELKDTRFQRLLNEYNRVPEFLMAFPEIEDPRALVLCRLVDGEYQEEIVGPGGVAKSAAIPGLAFRVLPRDRWVAGYKFDVEYQGVPRPRLAGERARADEERARADEERARADEARARADEARARADEARARADEARVRADALAAKLRELGVDPENI